MWAVDTAIAGALLALLSALMFACSGVSAKKAFVQGLNPIPGTYITLVVGIPVIFLAAWANGDFYKPLGLATPIIVALALAGIIHFLAGRVLIHLSIHHVGASRSGPLASTSSLYAAFFAIIFLSEVVTIPAMLGMLFTVGGVATISASAKEGKGNESATRVEDKYSLGITLGLIAGFLWGISPLFVRVGVLGLGSPITASLIAYVFAVVLFTPYMLAMYHKRPSYKASLQWAGGRLKFIVLAGIFTALAQILFYSAMSLSQVAYVVPLSNTASLFTLFLSFLLIRKVEALNWKVVMGVVATVLGVTLIVQA